MKKSSSSSFSKILILVFGVAFGLVILAMAYKGATTSMDLRSRAATPKTNITKIGKLTKSNLEGAQGYVLEVSAAEKYKLDFSGLRIPYGKTVSYLISPLVGKKVTVTGLLLPSLKKGSFTGIPTPPLQTMRVSTIGIWIPTPTPTPTLTPTPTPSSLPDLAIVGQIVATPYYPTLIYFKMSNIGLSPATPAQYNYTDQAGGFSEIHSSNTCTGSTSLKPGESCVSAYLFTFPSSGMKTFTIKLDPDNLLKESNESNNSYSFSVNVIIPTPTPTPTPALLCPSSIGISLEGNCSSGYTVQVSYSCGDGYSGTLGDGITCVLADTLTKQATEICKEHAGCPSPTAYVPTATPAPTP